MAEIVGVVEQISSRDGAYGKMYSYKVNGQYYGAGKYPVRDVKEGDLVKVKYTTNDRGYHNIDKGGMVKQDPRSDAAASPEPTPTTASRPAYVDPRQDIISKQSAFNTALTFLDLQIKLGGVKYPANAKAADIFESFNGMVLTEAARIYQLNTGKEWVIEAAPPVQKPAPKSRSTAPAEPDPVAEDSGYDEYPN
jgi:hypothetical protein